MTSLLGFMRFLFGALAICALAVLVTPIHAEPQVPPVNPQASAISEQSLLQQAPRIEGRIDIPNETAHVLMQPDGRVWRYFHEVILHWTGALVILGMIALLGIAYLIMGRIRISAGRSGAKVPRFNTFERFSHWLTAATFVVLGLTGLNITFGKLLLLPIIGPEAFTSFSEAAQYVHNFVSFAFFFGLVLIVVIWMRDNIPSKVDIVWLKEGGGFIRSKHPTAGRFNAGEKLVFWFALGAGAAVSVSGYLLLFPFYVTDIAGMQVAQVVHSIIAVLF